MTGYNGWGGHFGRQIFIPHPDAGAIVDVALTFAEQELKRRMLACHITQRAMLMNFSVEVEKFRSAPRHDFLAPPHRGPLLYERFGWGATGLAWRRTAKVALRQLDLIDRM